MDPSQFTRFLFPRITIHQTYIISEPRMRHPSSWDAIISVFFQSLLTNKRWTPYNKLKLDHHNISKFILPPDTHSKYAVAKENFEVFLISIRFRLVKDTTLSSSKSPKSHVKIVTYMHNENDFDVLISVVFDMSPQLGGLDPKIKNL